MIWIDEKKITKPTDLQKVPSQGKHSITAEPMSSVELCNRYTCSRLCCFVYKV